MIQKIKPWIFNTIEGLRDLTPKEVIITYTWVKENIIPLLGINSGDITPVGSYGKKINEISSDIDIAISINALKTNDVDPLDFIDLILKNNGYETKKIPGFNQISFAAPLTSSHREGFAQVDFMLSDNLEWSKFIYHSPDFTKNESNYKGVMRTLLMMSILSESTRCILSKDPKGNTLKVESKIIRLPNGIFSTRRSFIGQTKRLKKSKLLKQYDRFITNDPYIATKIILGEKYTPKDLNSFETIWFIINKPDFIHKEYLGLILDKFKLGLIINNLQIPNEFIKNYPQLFNEKKLTKN